MDSEPSVLISLVTPPLLLPFLITCRDFWHYLLVQAESANESKQCASLLLSGPRSQIKGTVGGDREHGFVMWKYTDNQVAQANN